ncbi:uncharacterized protein DS421_12g367580 [Arachis hypogaea]|nr:uncharacterized protein DS421_12g367580 [Arachis hypogaea]
MGGRGEARGCPAPALRLTVREATRLRLPTTESSRHRHRRAAVPPLTMVQGERKRCDEEQNRSPSCSLQSRHPCLAAALESSPPTPSRHQSLVDEESANQRTEGKLCRR